MAKRLILKKTSHHEVDRVDLKSAIADLNKDDLLSDTGTEHSRDTNSHGPFLRSGVTRFDSAADDSASDDSEDLEIDERNRLASEEYYRKYPHERLPPSNTSSASRSSDLNKGGELTALHALKRKTALLEDFLNEPSILIYHVQIARPADTDKVEKSGWETLCQSTSLSEANDAARDLADDICKQTSDDAFSTRYSRDDHAVICINHQSEEESRNRTTSIRVHSSPILLAELPPLNLTNVRHRRRRTLYLVSVIKTISQPLSSNDETRTTTTTATTPTASDLVYHYLDETSTLGLFSCPALANLAACIEVCDFFRPPQPLLRWHDEYDVGITWALDALAESDADGGALEYEVDVEREKMRGGLEWVDEEVVAVQVRVEGVACGKGRLQQGQEGEVEGPMN